MNTKEELKRLAETEEECNEGVDIGAEGITTPKKVVSKEAKASPKPKAETKSKKK